GARGGARRTGSEDGRRCRADRGGRPGRAPRAAGRRRLPPVAADGRRAPRPVAPAAGHARAGDGLRGRPRGAAAPHPARRARLAGALAGRLDAAAGSFGADDKTGKVLGASARAAAGAEKRLAEAAKQAAEGAAGEAETLRAAADALLRGAAEKVAAAAPGPP